MAGAHARHREHAFLQMFLHFCLALIAIIGVSAQPALVQFQDCFSSESTDQKLNISQAYAQVIPGDSGEATLKFLLFGTTPQVIVESSTNTQDPVATTLFTTTSKLTFDVWDNNSYFCATLRPPSPLPNASAIGRYCPLSPGPFALSSTIELGKNYPLATFDTRLYALDPDKRELLCLDFTTTPLHPNSLDPVYGNAHVLFWATVALAMAYWLVVGIARLITARGRGFPGGGLWAKVEGAGFILASAISGERLATSPALMRFCTPSLRDIIFHTQWCAALAMVAVQWPGFIYPILSQTAWSMLSYNISLSQGNSVSAKHWDPLAVEPFNPPSNFVDQLNNVSSPIFIDSSATNVIFQLPSNATAGIESFAYAVGLRPEDLFGICLSIFLAIMAAALVVSILVWCIDWVASLLSRSFSHSTPALPGSRSPRYSAASKDMLEGISQLQNQEERSSNGHVLFRTTSRFPFGRPLRTLQISFVSFHSSVLQGNLVRILILFHLPVTIFSCYQMTIGRSRASLVSIILAAIAFSIVSVLLPIFLIVRLTLTNTGKLYEETWTLLSLGPLYNHYRHGSQLFACLLFATNLAFGITIGCGQKSGTAQAIVILVIEVVSALGTSVWLPWGHGASMGLISFLFCVARIVIAVLLVILTPIVSVGSGAAQWVAYAILLILGLIYLAFTLMLIIKLVEAALRIFGRVGFHETRHAVDSGLLGVLGWLGCCGTRRRPRRAGPARYAADPPPPATLPLSRPAPTYRDVTPTSSAPPSVLRPEHALQPYKEESDDETGYIMGAWQPFPRPGYTSVESQPSVTEQQKSGFARVGGGRAHYESPYAITSGSARGSTQTFPSVERNFATNSLSNVAARRDSPPPTPSISSVTAPKKADLSLPPGAMPPGQVGHVTHVRTKSQTAIIEDASTIINLTNIRPTQDITDNYFDSPYDAEAGQPKKKWFNLRKNRRLSEVQPSEFPAASSEPGKSFVVVRKGKPGGPAKDASSSSAPEQHSFKVIRGNQSASS